MRVKDGVSLVGGLLFLLSVTSAHASLEMHLIENGQTASMQSPAMTCQEPVPMACQVICDFGYYTTVTISASGGNCTDAQSALTLQLQSIARGNCESITMLPSYCAFQVVITTTCAQVSPGVWQVQGYAKHHCRMSTC